MLLRWWNKMLNILYGNCHLARKWCHCWFGLAYLDSHNAYSITREVWGFFQYIIWLGAQLQPHCWSIYSRGRVEYTIGDITELLRYLLPMQKCPTYVHKKANPHGKISTYTRPLFATNANAYNEVGFEVNPRGIWNNPWLHTITISQALFCATHFCPKGKFSPVPRHTPTLWQMPQDVMNIHED